MYPYHNRILQRINNGELIGIEKSNNAEFAFILVFNTMPFSRPIRPHASFRYEFLLNSNKENKAI